MVRSHRLPVQINDLMELPHDNFCRKIYKTGALDDFRSKREGCSPSKKISARSYIHH